MHNLLAALRGSEGLSTEGLSTNLLRRVHEVSEEHLLILARLAELRQAVTLRPPDVVVVAVEVMVVVVVVGGSE